MFRGNNPLNFSFLRYRGYSRRKITTDVIDFGKGYPSNEILPIGYYKQAVNETPSLDRNFLNYAPEKGLPGFLKNLSEFLNNTVGYSSPKHSYHVNPSHLMATAGCSQGLNWVCTQFTTPGDTIFVEEATYHLALEIFKRDHKLKVVSIPQDSEGIQINEKFEQLCIDHKPKFIYIIPTHGNPTGKILSLQRRYELLQSSRRYNFLIISDDVYQMINFGDYNPPPTLVAIDEEPNGTVISLGTFSKIFAPGLRLGWIHTKNDKLLKQLVNSGEMLSGGNAGVTAAIGERLLASGLQRLQLQKYNEIYQSRTRKGIEELNKRFHPNSKLPLTIPDIKGGYFVWAKLPRSNASELLKKAIPHKVKFAPGRLFNTEGRKENYIRFCFVYWRPEEIEEGIRRLAQALEV